MPENTCTSCKRLTARLYQVYRYYRQGRDRTKAQTNAVAMTIGQRADGAAAPLISLEMPDCAARIPCYTAIPAYLRSFAGVSHRRPQCPTRTSPRPDSSTVSAI